MTLNKDDLYKVASDAYYMRPEMVKFLLVENLALKTLLHDKGFYTPEEFRKYQEQAAETLDDRAKHQMAEHLKQMMESGEKKNGPITDV
jgi:uncharacterized protein HemY